MSYDQLARRGQILGRCHIDPCHRILHNENGWSRRILEK
jgi:hypothetical protein